jgi:hypothetical protein
MEKLVDQYPLELTALDKHAGVEQNDAPRN